MFGGRGVGTGVTSACASPCVQRKDGDGHLQTFKQQTSSPFKPWALSPSKERKAVYPSSFPSCFSAKASHSWQREIHAFPGSCNPTFSGEVFSILCSPNDHEKWRVFFCSFSPPSLYTAGSSPPVLPPTHRARRRYLLWSLKRKSFKTFWQYFNLLPICLYLTISPSFPCLLDFIGNTFYSCEEKSDCC